MARSLSFRLTPDDLAAKQRQLAESGVDVTPPSGRIVHDTVLGKVILDYSYDAAAQLLTVTIVQHPPFAEGKVAQTIGKWFGA